MKNPYFTTKHGKLFFCDSLSFMRETDIKPDIIFTDPPYGVNFKRKNIAYMPGDNIDLYQVVMPLLYKLLLPKGGIFLFCSVSKMHSSLLSFQTYFRLHNILIWDKINAVYPHSKYHYCLQYEPILYGSKGAHQLKHKKTGDIFSAKIVRGKKKVHPSQKPENLLENILHSTQHDNCLLFDPFFGSGTLGVVAEKLNISWIGCEINEKYCEIAAKRIESSKQQGGLF